MLPPQSLFSKYVLALIVSLSFVIATPGQETPAQTSGRTTETDRIGELNRKTGELYREGKYLEAIEAAKEAVALAGQPPRADSHRADTALNYLGLLHKELGRFAEAEAYYRRALSLQENALGPEHSRLAQTLSNLGNLFQAQARYTEAEQLYQRALRIMENMLGPNHERVAGTLNNLAGVYQAQGRYEDAERLYRRVVAIAEATLGLESARTATALNNLGSLYQTQGRYGEAEDLYKRSLDITEKALGADHPNVAVRLNNLAELYLAQGRYDAAEPIYKRAISLFEKTLGPDHPNHAIALSNLGQLYAVRGQYEEAEAVYKRSLRIFENALGADNIGTTGARNNLAALFKDQGRFADAEPLLKQNLVLIEQALGPGHPNVSVALGQIAELYFLQGRFSDAEPFFRRALEVVEEALGPNHASVGTALNNLVQLYLAQERYADVEPLMERTLSIQERALGPKHPDVAIALNTLGRIYGVQGRIAKGEPLLKRALEIQEEALGRGHPDNAVSLSILADLQSRAGRFAEAEDNYRRAVEIQENALGPDHPDLSSRLDNLASVYLLQGKWQEASRTLSRSTDIVIKRMRRGIEAQTGGSNIVQQDGEVGQASLQFLSFIKAASRIVPGAGDMADPLAREMFLAAQWAQNSDAAGALAQMATRGAQGDPELSRLVRERQDLGAEWQKLDASRLAAILQPPEQRDPQSEARLGNRLAEIDERLAAIDKALQETFPDYAALSLPEPLDVEAVQATLSDDEALVLFLDTVASHPLPEETFIWVITKTDARWVRSDIGTGSLKADVQVLRCGLDYTAWQTGDACAERTGLSEPPSYDALPFDLSRSHVLYRALFGQVEDMIRDKHLLIVPSGALTQLPFQVLVTRQLETEIYSFATLDIAIADATPKEGLDSAATPSQRVLVASVVENGAGARAGLESGDVLLAMDGVDVNSSRDFITLLRARSPGAYVELKILRNQKMQVVTAVLGERKVAAPLVFNPAVHRDVPWLARKHPMTILPAASSLKALRLLARPSAAVKPMIGFGNPLLDGPDRRYESYAKLARSKQSCRISAFRRFASLFGLRNGVAPISTDGGLADPDHIRQQTPLPETADELCAVARDINAEPDDIWLGANATESRIKSLSEDETLSQYRIVHFATHGAMAGELSGSNEPGLILTPPAEATPEDDGYLTASEIAALKLDADLVILSACNTAAGNSAEAEALSGLARAFIYAQARALLVSHWAVDSNATVKLITAAIREIGQEPEIGRAEALRRAMLSLIDQGEQHEAHPAFWAPFVVVGEGG